MVVITVTLCLHTSSSHCIGDGETKKGQGARNTFLLAAEVAVRAGCGSLKGNTFVVTEIVGPPRSIGS